MHGILNPRRSGYVFHYQDHLQRLPESVMADLLPAHCHSRRVHYRLVLCDPEGCQKRGGQPDEIVFPLISGKFQAGHCHLADPSRRGDRSRS